MVDIPTLDELCAALTEYGYPWANGGFTDAEMKTITAPFVVLVASEGATEHADNGHWLGIDTYTVQLYRETRNYVAESTLERILVSHGIDWQYKSVSNDTAQNLVITAYAVGVCVD